ncbi:hypothetical protein [Nitrosopumilus sp.]|uniref:hypothetical protein n=1 Tax=Nitrosopumilus sp. TaxID=2024843 RepID=UPI0034A03234
MSLKEQIDSILADFEHVSSSEFIEVLNSIKPHFKNKLIVEYLEGKIQKIENIQDEKEKLIQCKTLLPYLDWYLQGL